MALKKSGIRTPADLAGKTMGAPAFDAGRKAFPVLARANRVDTSKITWKSMDPPLRETMLQRGDVDAITGFTFTSFIGLTARGIKEEDIVMMKFNDFGAELYGNAIIVNPRFISEKPEAVSGFLRAINRAIKEVVASPDAHIGLVKQRDPLTTEAPELKRLKMMLEFVDTPVARRDGLGASTNCVSTTRLSAWCRRSASRVRSARTAFSIRAFCRRRATASCSLSGVANLCAAPFFWGAKRSKVKAPR